MADICIWCTHRLPTARTMSHHLRGLTVPLTFLQDTPIIIHYPVTAAGLVCACVCTRRGIFHPQKCLNNGPFTRSFGRDSGAVDWERCWSCSCGRTGLLGVAFEVGASIPACERVAAVAYLKAPPIQRLARGSGARAFVRQHVAVKATVTSNGRNHTEVEPDACARQGRAQAPTAADRAKGVGLVIISWNLPRFVRTVTLAHDFVRGLNRCHRGGE